MQGWGQSHTHRNIQSDFSLDNWEHCIQRREAMSFLDDPEAPLQGLVGVGRVKTVSTFTQLLALTRLHSNEKGTE